MIVAAMFALLGAAKNEDGKFSENVKSSRTEHVDADFGTTTQHNIADNTRVEFPDQHPSSMSVS